MVVTLFHEHLHTRNLFELSTWNGFLESTLPTFIAFFHRALAPLLCIVKTSLSHRHEEAHHPFRQCLTVPHRCTKPTNLSCRRGAKQWPITSNRVRQHCFIVILSVQRKYNKHWTLLKTWFEQVLRFGWLLTCGICGRIICSYLPTTFGHCQMHNCESFYGFHPLRRCIRHPTLFRTVPTDEQQQKMVDIGCHYKLYQHWSSQKSCFVVDKRNLTESCLFFWNDVERAFVEHDVKQCQHYKYSFRRIVVLSRFKLFNNHARSPYSRAIL